MLEPPDIASNPRLRQGFLNVISADEKPFSLRAVAMPDPAKIPPRQWIYGTQLIRGFVSLLVAPGGTGKSSYILGACISIAICRALFGTRIHQQCNTALLNLEDPQEEIDRRIAAIGLHYHITTEDLAGRFFMSPAERVVTIADTGPDGFDVVYPDEKAIIEKVRDEKIGVLAVDPFAESHMLEENSNPQMIQAAAAWRRVARLGDCAVLLAHHVRKGHVDSIEAARGAKALTDSARIGLLLATMSEEEGEQLGVPTADRLQYVRLDDAKANLAPRAAKAQWYHLNHIDLGNATPDYPHGDQVVVLEAYTPKSVFERLTVEECNAALDRIAAGLPDGGLYSHHHRSGERWAARLLAEMFEITESQAAVAMRTWIENGVLYKEPYHDAILRKDRVGLRVRDALRPGQSR